MQRNQCLQGYWENAIEQIEEEDNAKFGSLGHPDHGMRALQNSINSLIDNLNDMPKEDAITTLVDLYEEKASEEKEYTVHCIEHGEAFTTTLKTRETDPDKLKRLGAELAMGWGAECIKVEPKESNE